MVWAIVGQWARVNRIRAYARRHGLIYIGSDLPLNFPLPSAVLGRVTSISNAVKGKMRSGEFVFFDCRVGSGKHSHVVSVFATRGDSGGFGPERFDLSLTTERVEGWTVLYRDAGILTVEELEALVASG